MNDGLRGIINRALSHIRKEKYLGLSQDAPEWTKPGKSIDIGGDRLVDLGNGVIRREFSGGAKEIYGLTVDGKPAWQQLWNKQLSWGVDEKAVRGLFGTSSAHAYRVADKGADLTIYSESQLSSKTLGRLTENIASLPAYTRSKIKFIYVLGSTGQVSSLGEDVEQSGGVTTGWTGEIMLAKRFLTSRWNTHYVLDHESGHILEYAPGAPKDKFGDGEFVSRPMKERIAHFIGKIPGSGWITGRSEKYCDLMSSVSWKKSSFVSEYASRNQSEDFADTHRFLMKVRNQYLRSHPGEDLLSISPDRVKQEWERRHLSPEIQAKLDALVGEYRTLAGA